MDVLPGVALVNVLTRFPLKSIARFRLVSKEWKSLIDSDYFRDRYTSFNSSSSSVSWSIIQMKPHKLSLEIAGHYGCQRWGLNRSPGSFMCFLAETTITKLLVLSCTDGLVLIYAETINKSPLYYIGNPLLQDWFRIPLPHFLSKKDLERLQRDVGFSDNGLVTKMVNGMVVSYKVVWMLRPKLLDKLDFLVYSPETGMWKNLNVACTCLYSTIWSGHDKSISLNGILHWLSQGGLAHDASSIVAYDFYGGHNDGMHQCHSIHFPTKDDAKRRFRRTFTTSEGSIVYFNEFHDKGNRTLRVWKLVKYTDGPEAWELLWEYNTLVVLSELVNDYVPVVMHPLNSEIIYLWSREKRALILFNLRTHVFSFHKETTDQKTCMDGCILSFNGCREYMERYYRYYLQPHQALPNHLFFSQYVLPRWLNRLPRPQPT